MGLQRLGIFAAFLSLIAGAGTARADLINGSFESGSYAWDHYGGHLLSPGSTVMDGWTTFGGDLVALNSDLNLFGITTPFGRISLDLAAYANVEPYGGVQQSVATEVGRTYELSFYLGTYSRSDSAGVTVTAGGSSGILVVPDTSLHDPWTLETFRFTATDTETLIQIRGHLHTAGFIGLDNISIRPASVPEPASLVSLVVGALGILGLRLRRRSLA